MPNFPAPSGFEPPTSRRSCIPRMDGESGERTRLFSPRSVPSVPAASYSHYHCLFSSPPLLAATNSHHHTPSHRPHDLPTRPAPPPLDHHSLTLLQPGALITSRLIFNTSITDKDLSTSRIILARCSVCSTHLATMLDLLLSHCCLQRPHLVFCA